MKKNCTARRALFGAEREQAVGDVGARFDAERVPPVSLEDAKAEGGRELEVLGACASPTLPLTWGSLELSVILAPLELELSRPGR
eukprot:1639624-Alexandrium_andersonii.AAC.1